MATFSSQPAPRWFVVYTHARSERKVHTALTEMGIRSFLPLRTIRRKTRQGIRDLEVPLFSNYVFVQSTPDRIASIPKVSGLAQLVSFGGRPTPVSDEEVATIRRSCSSVFRGKVGDHTVVVRHKTINERRPATRNTVKQSVPIGIDANRAA